MIVLDTHAWIWLVSEPHKLSSRARAAIDYEKQVGVCPISCWEISMKVSRGKLILDRDLSIWVKQALARPGLTLLDLSAPIAILAGQIDPFHGDPADRLIVATALHHGSSLITKDRAVRAFSGLRTIW